MGKFGRHVVSDCWAVQDFHAHHKFTKTPEESAALAINAGCDLNCGCTFEHALLAVQEGLLTVEAVDISLKRLLVSRFPQAQGFIQKGSSGVDGTVEEKRHPLSRHHRSERR